MKKNNFSPKDKKFLKKNKIDKLTTLIFQFLILISIIAIWELLTSVGLLDPFFFSSPSRIFKTIITILIIIS